MKVDLILWNSIAERRRSPSDSFLENGLGTLQSCIQRHGFTVEVVDWARNSYWEKFTPRGLSRFNRMLGSGLLAAGRRGKGSGKLVLKAIIPVFLLSQELTTVMQRRSMKNMLRGFAASVRDSHCRILGIKTWYGHAYTAAKALAGMVKKTAPEVLIVAGGPHPSIYRDAVLEDSGFDVAVIGEGERALIHLLEMAYRIPTKTELLKAIAREASQGVLKNVVYRDNDVVKISPLDTADANTKIVPVYTTLDGKTRIHVVVDSIGCPWGKCHFCVHSYIYPHHSLRDPQAVVDEIEEIVSADIGMFRFAGSTSSLSHTVEIARLLQERNIKIIYSFFARSEAGAADYAVYTTLVESYRLLVRSGLRAVFVGGEAADDDILKRVMGKGLAVEDIVATIRAMKEASVAEGLPLDIGLSLIYPSPTLGMLSLKELKALNIQLVQRTAPDSVLVNPPAPFPGTKWFRESNAFGFELGERFIKELLEYEYVLYKPSSLWPPIDLTMEGMTFHRILEACQDMRNALEDLGFITEITDEHFLMMRTAGYRGREGARTFKRESLLDILSSDYRWITKMENMVNIASREQALLNSR